MGRVMTHFRRLEIKEYLKYHIERSPDGVNISNDMLRDINLLIYGLEQENDKISKRCGMLKTENDNLKVDSRGEWIVSDFKNKNFLICSICKSVIDCNENYIDENEYDFCPYCGAYMK